LFQRFNIQLKKQTIHPIKKEKKKRIISDQRKGFYLSSIFKNTKCKVIVSVEIATSHMIINNNESFKVRQ